MAFKPITSEMLTLTGYNGETIEAYYAQPKGDGPFSGVVVCHHGPGWDAWTGEVVMKLALHGYAAISPHVYDHYGTHEPDEAASRQRTAGGVPDASVQADLQAGVDYLRSLPSGNGKVGIIGFCFGGRQCYLGASQLKNINAAVDCWGGSVIVDDPAGLTPARPVAPIEYTKDISVPLMGIFGNEDANPDADQVNRTEAALKAAGKPFEFHRYDGAGHGFFAVDRPGYRPEQATDAWQKVFAFYEKHLGTAAGVK